MKTHLQNPRTLLLSVICLTLFVFSATAQQSKKISIQGFLKDANGKAVENKDNYEITFKLYPVSTGGTAEWSETQILNISGGVYSAQLGKTTSLENLNWGTSTYYVGVNIQGVELSPRTELTFAPYSLGSPSADKARLADLATKATTVVCSGAVGDVKYSILNPTQFALENGNCWVPMDGRSMTGSKLATIIGGTTVPNAGGLFLRGQEFSNSVDYDYDRNSGSPIAQVQSESLGSHSHSANLPLSNATASGGAHSHQIQLEFNSGFAINGMNGSVTGNASNSKTSVKIAGENHDRNFFTTRGFNTDSDGSHSHAVSGNAVGTTSSAGGNETRPDNLNLWTYIRIN